MKICKTGIIRSFRVIAVISGQGIRQSLKKMKWQKTIKKISMTFDQNESLLNDLRQLQKQGDAESEMYLGPCYYYGDGVAENMQKAVYWWRNAAEQGNEKAKALLKELGY